MKTKQRFVSPSRLFLSFSPRYTKKDLKRIHGTQSHEQTEKKGENASKGSKMCRGRSKIQIAKHFQRMSQQQPFFVTNFLCYIHASNFLPIFPNCQLNADRSIVLFLLFTQTDREKETERERGREFLFFSKHKQSTIPRKIRSTNIQKI